jgi:hypothetical protein
MDTLLTCAVFLSWAMPAGLEADSVTTSHPLTISRPIQKLSEIDNWFDDVSYAKGGAVLRMIRAWLNRGQGPEALGLASSGSTSDAAAAVGSAAAAAAAAAADLHQHMHRRMLLLLEATGDAAAESSSVTDQRVKPPDLEQYGIEMEAVQQVSSSSSRQFGIAPLVVGSPLDVVVGGGAISDGAAHQRQQQQQHSDLSSAHSPSHQYGQIGRAVGGSWRQLAEDTEEPSFTVTTAATAARDTGSSGSSSGDGSKSNGDDSRGKYWWTKRQHIGGAAAALQQQQFQQQQQQQGTGSHDVAAVPKVAAPAPAAALSPEEEQEEEEEQQGVTQSPVAAAAAPGAAAPASPGFDPSRDVFLKGLTQYLKGLQYGSSSHLRLWQQLEAASGEPVSDRMNTWTLRRWGGCYY